jgi:phospholipid/cholesterol/gamma-HCH transport system permease protein
MAASSVGLGLLGSLGRSSLAQLEALGRSTRFLGAALAALPRRPLRIARVVDELNFIGVRSMSVVVLSGAFTGMVLALQGYRTLRGFGSEALLGAAVALSLLRELAPVLAALMVTARAGSAITAELGIMRITEQIDAFEMMAVDPIKFLVAPRVLAAVLALPLLTAIFDLVGIWGGYLVAVQFLGLSPGTYFSSMQESVETRDILGGLGKAAVFGLLIAWISTFKGFFAQQGAHGVGQATTAAVVLTSVVILVSDYFLTSVLF